jgi:hypothetical protein
LTTFVSGRKTLINKGSSEMGIKIERNKDSLEGLNPYSANPRRVKPPYKKRSCSAQNEFFMNNSNVGIKTERKARALNNLRRFLEMYTMMGRTMRTCR